MFSVKETLWCYLTSENPAQRDMAEFLSTGSVQEDLNHGDVRAAMDFLEETVAECYGCNETTEAEVVKFLLRKVSQYNKTRFEND